MFFYVCLRAKEINFIGHFSQSSGHSIVRVSQRLNYGSRTVQVYAAEHSKDFILDLSKTHGRNRTQAKNDTWRTSSSMADVFGVILNSRRIHYVKPSVFAHQVPLSSISVGATGSAKGRSALQFLIRFGKSSVRLSVMTMRIYILGFES